MKQNCNNKNKQSKKSIDREKRRRLMIIGASCGLVLCLTTLVVFKKEMSEEVIGILYMITGIFGACLMDAYNFEFGFLKKKFRNKNKSKRD
ncbi:MAG: hypothetical protein K5766_02595 [Alphaproteobacteria bacterium]|nr:hypothetical protein [Alphaproteobacteria bacterium]MCR4555676.1 hypothetical protein [Alphaproteobacteria bacterium]